MTMGLRVGGQVGQQIWVGHGSVLVARWPMIELTRFQLPRTGYSRPIVRIRRVLFLMTGG